MFLIAIISLFLCGSAFSQAIQRNNLDTNPVSTAPANGWFLSSASGVPVWSINGIALTNLNQLNATNNDLAISNALWVLINQASVNATNQSTVVSNGVVAHTVQVQGTAGRITSSVSTAQPLSGNPATALDIANPTILPWPGSVTSFTNTGSYLSINGILYAWPSTQAGGNLFDDGAGNLSWVAGTNVTIPNTITPTNFVLNTRYTNNSGSIQIIDATVALVSAAVSGNTSLSLYSDQSGGSSFSLQDQARLTTLVTSIAATDTRNLIGAVSNQATYYFTNDSSGAGNSSSIVTGTGEIVTLADGSAANVASSLTTITINGTANQVASSAGAQSLAANRTWTLSLTSPTIFPGQISVVGITNASGNSNSVAIYDSKTNLIYQPTGTGALTNNGSGAMGWDPLITENMWTNNGGSIGLVNNPPASGQFFYFGPISGASMTNVTVEMLFTGGGASGIGDGLQISYGYSGTNNFPEAIVASISRQSGAYSVSEGRLNAIRGRLLTTNLDFTQWNYPVGDAAIGVIGEAIDTTEIGSGASLGVRANTSTKTPFNAGLEAVAIANVNAQTNIAATFSEIKGSRTGGANVAIYAEVTANQNTQPVWEDAVIIADNTTIAAPLFQARTNRVDCGSIDKNGIPNFSSYIVTGTTNQVIFGATNLPPASVATPTKWISVQVSGETTVYRIPLYQ